MSDEGRHEIKISVDGPKVILTVDGRYVSLPWNAAKDIARLLLDASNSAEEIAKREQLVFDNALLIRKGIPFGLIRNPALQAESIKEAAWNTPLRKYIPQSGISSKSIVGVPTLIMKERKEDGPERPDAG